MNSTGHLGSQQRPTGRPPALTGKETRIFFGWVLTCNEERSEVHLDNSRDFVKDSFHKEFTRQTTLNYLLSGGFTVHKLKSTRAGFQPCYNELEKLALKCVKQLRKDGAFIEGHRVWCIDFTYSSTGGRIHKGFSARGG